MSARRFMLGIETSNPSTGCSEVAMAPMGAGGIDLDAAVVERLSAEVRHDDGVMPAISRAATALGASPSEIGRVVVSVGPGGYTGLRVAVTTAKAIAHAAGAGVVGVPTALVAREAGGWGAALVCLASKNDRASAWRVDAGACWCVGVLDAGGVRAHADLGVIVGDPHLPASFSEAAADAGMRVEGLKLGAVALLRASVRVDGCRVDELGPIYAREPDAVTQWRARHGERGGQGEGKAGG